MTVPEYGLFHDEGCFEAQMYSPAEAQTRRQEHIAQGAHPDDVIVKELCPHHEGEANNECEECCAELAGDDEHEAGQ